jgi:Zn-dependent peptidase ImmA (M78 family)
MGQQIMNFEINSNKYKLIVVDELEDGYLGVTDYHENKVSLKRLDLAIMRRTLKHELMHVWLWEYGHNQHDRQFTNEDVCEIVASSNNFINHVVTSFDALYTPQKSKK